MKVDPRKSIGLLSWYDCYLLSLHKKNAPLKKRLKKRPHHTIDVCILTYCYAYAYHYKNNP